MDKGIIWDSSKGYPEHVISWHELNLPKLGNVRVWIHSKGKPLNEDFNYGGKNENRVVFLFGSIEIQVHGSQFKPVTEKEKHIRLELAQNSPENTFGSVKSSNFRFIPVGQLEIDHMQCIQACYQKNKFNRNRSLRIVDSQKTSSLIFKNGKIVKSISSVENNIKNKKVRATQENAIAIAKMYSDLSNIGNQKVIKQISINTGLTSEYIYTALRVARAQGWLTSKGAGKTGGSLSSSGLQAFEELNGESSLKYLLSSGDE